MMLISTQYKTVPIQGWKVNVSQTELQDPSWKAVRAELGDQLYRITRAVGSEPLKKLRTIIIWVHHDDPANACAAFNPSADWLKQHNSDPKMAGGVEISNAVKFVDWTHQQPFMVLHELAHAYNFYFIKGGFSSPMVHDAYVNSMAGGKYDHVLHWDGKTAKAYATTNQMEYFSECTESYFGQNDYYPFVNAELKTFDPGAYRLMEQVWGPPVE